MGKKSIIADLRKKIEEKEKALGTGITVGYNAACSLLLDKYTPIDISTIKSKTRLAVIAGKLLRLKEDYEAGIKALELKPVSYKINGFTVDQWLEDIKARVKILSFVEEKAKIDAWKAKLDTLLTEEEWRELEIDKLRKELED